MVFGHPNLVMISSNINRVVVVALHSLTALASAHMVKYYVAVMMYLDLVCFPGGLIGPMKSMAHFSNDCKFICGAKGISSLLEGFPTLFHTSWAL
jgi:hypothetical protein